MNLTELAYLLLSLVADVVLVCLLANLYGERDAQNGKRNQWYIWLFFGLIPYVFYETSYQETKGKMAVKETEA